MTAQIQKVIDLSGAQLEIYYQDEAKTKWLFQYLPENRTIPKYDFRFLDIPEIKYTKLANLVISFINQLESRIKIPIQAFGITLSGAENPATLRDSLELTLDPVIISKINDYVAFQKSVSQFQVDLTNEFYGHFKLLVIVIQTDNNRVLSKSNFYDLF